MLGILFSAFIINVGAQDDSSPDVKPAKDSATDPLESTYGGRQLVENASLALAELANLQLIPGRKCTNGLRVPMNNLDRPKFVQGLRRPA
jgi:hypothetical protein